MDSQLVGICSDFYVNQKLALTLDVPDGRESVLDLFGRLKKEFPWLERLRRYDGEYALESEDVDDFRVGICFNVNTTSAHCLLVFAMITA